MAKKNIDFGKLDLGTKKPVKKPAGSSTTVSDQAVEKIHKQAEEAKKTPKERTKRVTLDIPLSLHAAIRKHTFDEGITMKEYFLTLAKADIGFET